MAAQRAGHRLDPADAGTAADLRHPVFVLGDPKYYLRFGFFRVREPRCPFDATNEHFMALRFTGNAPFIIGYEKDFS